MVYATSYQPEIYAYPVLAIAPTLKSNEPNGADASTYPNCNSCVLSLKKLVSLG